MPSDFNYDICLTHDLKDQEVVRPLAERLRVDGLRVWFSGWEIKRGNGIRERLDEILQQSRVLVLCMSSNSLGSGWAILESDTYRFRDPLNIELRFILLRLDDASIKDAFKQSPLVDWRGEEREHTYKRLLEACQQPGKRLPVNSQANELSITAKIVQLNKSKLLPRSYSFSRDGKRALTGGTDRTVRLWNIDTGQCILPLIGHQGAVTSVALSPDGHYALSGSTDRTVRLWDIDTGRCIRTFQGHSGPVTSVAWSHDGRHLLSGSIDRTVRLWNLESEDRLRSFESHRGVVTAVVSDGVGRYALSGSDDHVVRIWDINARKRLCSLRGHNGSVASVAWSPDRRHALSGSTDRTVRLWDIDGRCIRTFEGHSGSVTSVAWSPDGHYALSGSTDRTVRLWDIDTGRCIRSLEGHREAVTTVDWDAVGRHALSGDTVGNIHVWDLLALGTQARPCWAPALDNPPDPDQIEYTNAKVLVVGDTSAGKTGLTHRLATGEWKSSEGSTIGAWSTQWVLPGPPAGQGLEQEIWLWDFGGQADQRLVHQLFMDRAALILLLFDADKDDVLPGLRDWQTALRRCGVPSTLQLLVAGRIDAGFKASRAKLQGFATDHGCGYHETSAKEGSGCKELIETIKKTIDWEQIEKLTSPRIFKLIKDEILMLRDEGKVLHTFKELRELLWERLSYEPRFTDETLQTVIRLLDGPGVVKELDYGTYVLLMPEWISTYAQAVIRTLRQDSSELGCLPLRSIAEGRLIFQSVDRDGSIIDMKRLPADEERVVLREMERQLEERGLCLRQGDKLVFPSHCGRDRPDVSGYPSVFVSYTVHGYLDDIYATLVVTLADSKSFRLKELWRDAADFATLSDNHRMGIKLTRADANCGDISLYFAPGVSKQEQVIFANYIHAHLADRSEKVQRLRHYVCPHCHTPKGNPLVLMQKLLARQEQATVECDICELRFDLWDELERRFASEDVRRVVEKLQAVDANRLDSRRKGKLLALEVGARITSANQKCFEIPGTEDEGIDMELEFTNDQGQGTGKRLYLQLKSGNAHLERRKNGVEIFRIREDRWVEYWLNQPYPVMLVIGTFDEGNEPFGSNNRLEYADVRWMEIGSLLKRLRQKGKKPIKQIEFKGERLDMASVRRWRDLERFPNGCSDSPNGRTSPECHSA